MPKIEEDGKSWLRRPKLCKGVVEPYKKKTVCFDFMYNFCPSRNSFYEELETAIIINIRWSSRKVQGILVRFY